MSGPRVAAHALRVAARWLPPVAWMGLIFYLSSLSSPPGQDIFPGQDKVEHFLLYLVLGPLLFRAISNNPAARSAAIGCAYALTDEIHQAFVIGRSADLLDVVVDFSAVAAGVALMALARRRARRARAVPARPGPGA